MREEEAVSISRFWTREANCHDNQRPTEEDSGKNSGVINRQSAKEEDGDPRSTIHSASFSFVAVADPITSYLETETLSSRRGHEQGPSACGREKVVPLQNERKRRWIERYWSTDVGGGGAARAEMLPESFLIPSAGTNSAGSEGGQLDDRLWPVRFLLVRQI